MTLVGRSAVVTGGGRGIGRAIAVALARAGVARVMLVARTADQLEAAAAAVVAEGAEAVVVAADLSRLVDLPRLDADILINNAAMVAPLGPTVALDPDQIALAFRLNSVAPILLAAQVAPAMVSRGWGRIVAVSSGIVDRPGGAVGSSVYAATKSALEAHTLALAAELDGTGVTVNSYRPGIVDTSMQEYVREQDPDTIGRELHERFVEHRASGSLLTPEHSAQVLVSRLAGDETGAVWRVGD